ncbi:hypothetical protein ABZT16_12550 [Streptomyces flaveolus]
MARAWLGTYTAHEQRRMSVGNTRARVLVAEAVETSAATPAL